MDDLRIQAHGKGEAKWVEVWLPQCIDRDFRILRFFSTLDVSGVHHMFSFHFIILNWYKKANK